MAREAGRLRDYFARVEKAAEGLLRHESAFPGKSSLFQAQLRKVAGHLRACAREFEGRASRSLFLAEYWVMAARASSDTATAFEERSRQIEGATGLVRQGFERVREIREFCQRVGPTLEFLEKGWLIDARVMSTLTRLVTFSESFVRGVEAFVELAKLFRGPPPAKLP